MVKVLISPLGASNYGPAHYKFSDGSIYETPFIAAALANYLKVDKIILVGTDKSIWNIAYDYFKENNLNTTPEFDKNSLNSKLKELNKVIDNYLKTINGNASGNSSCKIIEYGRNKEELWNNFDIFMDIINDEVQDGDEIYLDITHSFRSIPLFMYIMMEFIQTLKMKKNTKLAGLYYGMFEGKVKEVYNNEEVDVTPVVDLKPVFEISKWIKAVYDFTNYGNGYLISDLLKQEDEDISNSINRVSIYVDSNDLGKLKKEINNLKLLMESTELKDTKFLKYFKPHIDEFLNRFKNVNSDYQFQLAMAKWHFDNKKYSSGYLCLSESIFWGLCEAYNISTEYRNRELMKSLVRDNRMRLYEKYSQLKDLRDIHDKLKEIRNKIAHADVNINEPYNNDTADAIENFEEYYQKVKEQLDNEQLKNLPVQLPLEKLVEEYIKYRDIKNASLCLSILIVNKLCDIYGLDSKKQYDINLMNNLLLNRKLTDKNKNELLYELNEIYYNITINKKYLRLDKLNRYYRNTKEILNNKKLNNIPKDVPLMEIKRAYNNYKNSKNRKKEFNR